MNTIRKIFLNLLFVTFAFFAGCQGVLTGRLKFEGKPIEKFTSVKPLFSFNNLDTNQRGIKPRAEYDKGQYKIYDLRKGNYNIFVSIDANPNNPGRYPGYPGDFFKLQLKVPVSGISETEVDIDMQKIIHLTSPQDNNDLMALWSEKGDNKIAFTSPVVFAWESLGADVEYHYYLRLMQSEPFKFIERILDDSKTKETSISVELPVSKKNEFYLFHLYAIRGQYRIGELKTHGKRGYGNDLRFRVKQKTFIDRRSGQIVGIQGGSIIVISCCEIEPTHYSSDATGGSARRRTGNR